MVEPATSLSFPVVLTAEDKADLQQLTKLAGLDIRPEALNSIIELLALGAKPHALGPVLQAICKPSLGGNTARQPSAEPAGGE